MYEHNRNILVSNTTATVFLSGKILRHHVFPPRSHHTKVIILPRGLGQSWNGTLPDWSEVVKDFTPEYRGKPPRGTAPRGFPDTRGGKTLYKATELILSEGSSLLHTHYRIFHANLHWTSGEGKSVYRFPLPKR